jgi:putative transposase
MSSIKNYKIKQTLLATMSRHKEMDCVVFELKIDSSRISQFKKRSLELAFCEAKWIYNEALSSKDIFKYNVKKLIDVKIFNPQTRLCDLIETRRLTLGSQIKQSLVRQIKQNIINLGKAKNKGLKTGKLKFKKEINSLPLKQVGITYRIEKNNITVQNLGKFKVSGLNQIRPEFEIANAVLLRKPSGYYFKITVFRNKKYIQRSDSIAFDFGIKDAITDSNGIKYNWNFDMKKIKRDCKRVSKKIKGSKNRKKAIQKLKISYEKINNKKDDASNKFISSLQRYKKVVIQDENLKGWQAGFFGSQIQKSILGRIKARIKNLATSQVIGRFLPTTQLCPKCEKKNKIPLSKRSYDCSCGFTHPCRDTKAAQTILILAERKSKPVEKEISFWECFQHSFDKFLSLKQEAVSY